MRFGTEAEILAAIAAEESGEAPAEPTIAAFPDERKCRDCGCTQGHACVTEEGPCYWIAADLCSACARAAATDDVDRALTVDRRRPAAAE
jgi:hypothetical protein